MIRKFLYPILTLWLFQAVIVAITFFWQNYSRSTMNHAFYSIAFTPLMVSDDLLWLQPIVVLILFLGISIFFRMALQWSWVYSALLSFLWIVPFPALCFVSRFQQPPPPVRLLPLTTYWGWDYSTIAGPMFMRDNLLVFILFITYPIFLLWKNRPLIERGKHIRYWAWATILPVCFLLSLSPFIVMQVGVYGYVGHYVNHVCDQQISELHLSLLRYAEDHESRLPIANDYKELFPQIKPYLKNADADTIRERYDVCVIGYAKDRPAHPFEWNKEFSGKEVVRDKTWSDIDNMERKSNPNGPAFCGGGREYFVAGEKWITCPYAAERINVFTDRVELPSDRFSPEKFRTVP